MHQELENPAVFGHGPKECGTTETLSSGPITEIEAPEPGIPKAVTFSPGSTVS